MKARNLFLVIILLLQVLSFSVFAATTSDDVTYTALGLENNNKWNEDFSGIITSSAEYAGHLEVESGDIVFRYGEGVLASIASAGYVSSIQITWGASAVDGTDVVDIYASNDPFTGDEFDGGGEYIATIYKGASSTDTYDFDEDYSYFLIVSTDVAHISSILITWTTRSSYAISTAAAHGTITLPDDSPVSFASEGDEVTLKMKRSGAYSMTGYSVYNTVDPTIVVKDVTYAYPETSPQTISFTMPGYAVTVEGKYISNPTATNTVSVINAGGDNLTDLTAMVSGDVLTYTYSAAADYAGVITVTSSNESVARVESTPTNAYSGTITIYAYATGTVKITVSFSADTQYRATSKASNAKTAVSRRPAALVTQHDGTFYAVTQSMSGTKFEALPMIEDDGSYYYLPTSGFGVSDITWYIETAYNSKGDRYRIYSAATGSTNLDADGMDFYLDTDVRDWKKDGSYFYGINDNRGIVYKVSSELFESQPYDSHDGSPALYAPSAIEVPISSISVAKSYSTSNSSANSYDSRSLTTGKMGTICVPFNVPMSFVSGATFYTIESKLVSAGNLTGLNLAEVTDNLEAGHSYIFEATGSSIDIYYGSVSATNASVIANDGFVGMLPGDGVSMAVPDGVTPRTDGCYGIASNKLKYVAEGGIATIKPYRAYIDASELSSGSPAPGRRVVLVDNSESGEQTYTSVEDLLNGASSVNWNEPVYNALGQRVGKGTTGVLIQNGKKFFVQ